MKILTLFFVVSLTSCSLVSKYTRGSNETQSFVTSSVNLTNDVAKTVFFSDKNFTGIQNWQVDFKSKKLQKVNSVSLSDVHVEVVLKSFNKVEKDVIDKIRRQEFSNDILPTYVIENNSTSIKSTSNVNISAYKSDSSTSFWDYTTGGMMGSALGYIASSSAIGVASGGFVGILGAKYISNITAVNNYLLVVDVNVFEKSPKLTKSKYKQVFKHGDNSMSEYYDEVLDKYKKITTKIYIITSSTSLSSLDAQKFSQERLNSIIGELL